MFVIILIMSNLCSAEEPRWTVITIVLKVTIEPIHKIEFNKNDPISSCHAVIVTQSVIKSLFYGV